MWETTDPDGRTVVLPWRHWLHIMERHPDIEVEPDMLMSAVAAPDRRTDGHETGEEWFYRRGAGPSRWIRAVVHYDDELGVIATAFPRRRFP